MTSSHRVNRGRAILAADVVGRGDPVVFLHAAICDRRMWHGQLHSVGTTNKAIAYDRRGFGETRAEPEEFSAIADLMTVMDVLGDSRPAILVACSNGGQIALDAALTHPTLVRGLVLISPSVSGAPVPVYPPEIAKLMLQAKEAQQAGDLDRVNAIKARLFLDGPLAPEGRVTGNVRQLFLDMDGLALRSPSVGTNLDAIPAYDRLGEISAPLLVMSGDLDFRNIQERSRHVAASVMNGTHHALKGVAHLPSLEEPETIAALIRDFIRHLPPVSRAASAW